MKPFASDLRNIRPRWRVILAEYQTIQASGAHERRKRPGICLADACQRIAELEAEIEALHIEADHR